MLLGLAIASTFTWMFFREYDHTAWFLALDVFWPLSMLGMAAIGVRIAIAGRWKGAGAVLAARRRELGAGGHPRVVPAGGRPLRGRRAPGHRLRVLGVILARRPELTGARD